MDEEGAPLLFPSVRKAIGILSKTLQDFSYSYPDLRGLDSFRSAVRKLVPPPPGYHLASIASTGGTGALAINLRLMRMLLGDDDPAVILPVPAWGNHPPPCKAAGLRIIEVPYLQNGAASIEGIADAVKKMKKPCGILLQVGCHNPTGLDFSPEQWRELTKLLTGTGIIALLDSAYQGFIGRPDEDIAPITMFVEAGIPSLLTWSSSKNHTIYGLRTGLAGAYLPSVDLIPTVEGHYSSITRMLHSASATFGQAIVAEVQSSFRDEWLLDLVQTRDILTRKRAALRKGLPEKFHACLRGFGMFAQLPLTPDQILRLKTESKVYMTLDGRLNIAGIPEKRMAELCEKIGRVL